MSSRYSCATCSGHPALAALGLDGLRRSLQPQPRCGSVWGYSSDSNCCTSSVENAGGAHGGRCALESLSRGSAALPFCQVRCNSVTERQGYSSDIQPVAKRGKPSITIIFLSFFCILTQRENKITSDSSLRL